MMRALRNSPTHHTSPKSFCSLPRPSAPVAAVSFAKFDGVLYGKFPDARAHRAAFKDMWVKYLHGNFSRYEDVRNSFNVSDKTARDWWNGITAPQGWAVDYAIRGLH